MFKSLTPIIIKCFQVDVNSDISEWTIKDKWVKSWTWKLEFSWMLCRNPIIVQRMLTFNRRDVLFGQNIIKRSIYLKRTVHPNAFVNSTTIILSVHLFFLYLKQSKADFQVTDEHETGFSLNLITNKSDIVNNNHQRHIGLI